MLENNADYLKIVGKFRILFSGLAEKSENYGNEKAALRLALRVR